MTYYLLLYDVVTDFLERRAPHRDEHLGLALAAHARGELVMGGALSAPTDLAVLLFRGPDGTAAERFAENDPYVTNGLVTSWRVRSWTVAIGGEGS